MTPAEAEELFAYDRWASERIFADVDALDDAARHRDVGTSHGSIFGTLVHLVSAEEVWLARWQGRSDVGLARTEDVGTLVRLRARWDVVKHGIETFVAALDREGLDRSIEIETSTGATFRHTFAEMFRHLANHSSYHRGQIVTLLRQAGADVSSTDLIRYYRER